MDTTALASILEDWLLGVRPTYRLLHQYSPVFSWEGVSISEW